MPATHEISCDSSLKGYEYSAEIVVGGAAARPRRYATQASPIRAVSTQVGTWVPGGDAGGLLTHISSVGSATSVGGAPGLAELAVYSTAMGKPVGRRQGEADMRAGRGAKRIGRPIAARGAHGPHRVSALGAFAHISAVSTKDFLRHKRQEKKRERARWQR